MPLRQRDLFEVLRIVCEHEEIYAAAKGSMKGGLIAGATTLLGGLLMGPPGMAIGGGLGGLLAYGTSDGFHPVGYILMNLPQHQKDDLQYKITTIVRHLDATDAAILLALVRADQIVYRQIINFVQDFVTSDLNMSIKT